MSDGYIGHAAVRAPDLIQTVIGVRGFERAGHMLASPFQGDEWRGPEQSAVCSPDHGGTAAALLGLGAKPKAATTTAARVVARQQRLRRHEAPDPECSCGIYAYTTPPPSI